MPEWWGDWIAILNKMVRGGLFEKLTLEQKLERGEEVDSIDVLVKSVLGGGTASAKALRQGMPGMFTE